MRLFRFIISIAVVTAIALAYVHQQISLVKLSYAIERKEKELEHVLDRKERLSYNITNLEAPSRLEKALFSQKIDVAFPKKGQVVKLAWNPPNAMKEKLLRTSGVERKVNIFGIFEFLGLRAEAQAKEK